jgi:peptidoglycan hydrolase-like protein with peptidoglycan-binding domain
MKAFQQILKDRGYYSGAIDGIVGPLTLGGAKQFIDAEMDRRGWVKPVTDLVWIRTNQSLDNKFSDYVVRFSNRIADMIMPCSTRPGNYWIFNPVTVGGITGTAIACEQQVIGSHTFVTSPNWKSLWLGAPYFMQTGAIEIYRDGNKDKTIDKTIKTKGWYGINFHRGGLGSIVDQWSAGCMVVPDSRWFEAIKIFKQNALYNFTLIEL